MRVLLQNFDDTICLKIWYVFQYIDWIPMLLTKRHVYITNRMIKMLTTES